MRQFSKILKFELKGYLKNKIFVGVTIFFVVLIAISMFIPKIVSFFETDTKIDDNSIEKAVMLIYSEDTNFSTLIKSYFDEAFINYNVTIANGSIENIKDDIINDKATCAFVMNSYNSYTYYVDDLSMYDSNTEIANSILQEVYRVNALMEHGLSSEEVNNIMSIQIDSNIDMLGKNQVMNFFYTYIMIFALYIVILLYGQMVATNVATEKSSRAMEVLITSAKPTSMMFGKILASCIAGFSQLFLIFGSAVLFYNLNKSSFGDIEIIDSIFNIPLNLFIYMLVFFVLGFLIYAFCYGAIGSTASKLEDINTSLMPITLIFVACFLVVMLSMSSGDVNSVLMKVCSFIPFTSPMAMFTRICMSTVPIYEIVISIAILIGSTVGIGFVSAKIYRVGVLLYGTTPKLSNILKTVFKS